MTMDVDAKGEMENYTWSSNKSKTANFHNIFLAILKHKTKACDNLLKETMSFSIHEFDEKAFKSSYETNFQSLEVQLRPTS